MVPFILMLLLAPGSAAQDAPLQMMTYQMVLLRAAPGHETDAQTPEAQKKQRAHLANLARLNRERVNVLYGPFLDNGDLRGRVASRGGREVSASSEQGGTGNSSE